MNFRATAALFFGVLLCVVVLFVFALTEEDAPRGDGGLVPTLAAAGLRDKDVETVEFARTKPTAEKLVFVKGPGGKWQLKEPHPAKVEGYQIDRLISDLFSAKLVPHPELTGNLATHGLAPATVRVTLKAGDKTATVNLGDTTIGGDRAVTFATTSDQPDKAVAVRRADLSGLFRDTSRGEPGEAWKLAKWLPDLRSRRLFDDWREPTTDLTGVKVTAGGKDLTLTRAPGKPWMFAAPAGYGEADLAGASEPTPDHFTGVRPLLNALAGLTTGGPEETIEKPDDLSKYGLSLDHPSLVRVELTPTNGPPEVIFLGNRVEKDGQPVTPPKVYARVDGDPAVFQVATDKLDALRNTVGRPAELRNRDVLPESDRDRIDAIDLTAGGQTVKLRKVQLATGARWVLYGGPNDPQEAKQTAVSDLLTTLTKPRQAKDVLLQPDDAAVAPSEQAATLKLWTGGVPNLKAEGDKLPEEPTPTGTPIELIFGKKSGDAVYLRRVADGSPTDLKVPGTLLAFVAKGRLDFLEPRLRHFAATDSTRLTIRRGSETVEVTKDGDKWAFTEPGNRKGQPADPAKVNGLLSVLAVLSPAKVLAEGPTPEQLRSWGLEPEPRLRATIGLKDGDPVVNDFGKETDDKLYAFARQEGKALAFTVPKVIVDRLLTDDLRDRTLYRIDPDQVVKLKIRGWKGPDGVKALLFEKSGSEWKPASPADYPVDPEKIAELLAALASPRIDDFLPWKPEQGLDVEKNPDGREFTLYFPEPNGPVTLVLGQKNADGRVFATSATIPGEAGVMDASSLTPLVETPDSLKK